jgi:hypothetical protein
MVAVSNLSEPSTGSGDPTPVLAAWTSGAEIAWRLKRWTIEDGFKID